ncbi:hypothetical protein E2C01_078621 [Portunus trituberculatus]|uniref:Uncharacterized protein n=1 Tax=Portunus trituberculatus TaxID=210409 RepID=A0A5B7IP93_PORTR|nr:hypothetical protein [Portunus trituberculatus]
MGTDAARTLTPAGDGVVTDRDSDSGGIADMTTVGGWRQPTDKDIRRGSPAIHTYCCCRWWRRVCTCRWCSTVVHKNVIAFSEESLGVIYKYNLLKP